MQRGIFVASLLVLVSAVPTARGVEPGGGANSRLEVTVDPRVELFSIIFCLAGNREYNQGKVEAYTKAVKEHFAAYRNHPVVLMARRLRVQHGVSYDAVMSLAIHTTDATSLEEAVPFEPRPRALDDRWPIVEAREFLMLARRFIQDAEFSRFVNEHEKLYATTVERMEKLLQEEAHLEWFDQYFGARPGARFTVALGLLNGGAGYGPRVVRESGEEDLYSVIGVWMTDDSGQPQFDPSVLRTIVHEFSHSYVNPLVYAHEQRLAPAGKSLFPWVEAAMRRQAYGSWTTMMHESLVRACVVRYLRRYGGEPEARREIGRQLERGFLWMKELSELLAEYEANRERYVTFERFFPRVIDFFDDYAPKFAAERQEQVARAPKLVSSEPANGAKDVDPALTALKFTFDRPMEDGNWSIVGGGPSFPKIEGKPRYDESRQILTVRVKLQPDHTYEFGLNSQSYRSFRSREGFPLEPVRVTFKTRSAPPDG